MPDRDLRFSIDRGGTFTDVFVEVLIWARLNIRLHSQVVPELSTSRLDRAIPECLHNSRCHCCCRRQTGRVAANKRARVWRDTRQRLCHTCRYARMHKVSAVVCMLCNASAAELSLAACMWLQSLETAVSRS